MKNNRKILPAILVVLFIAIPLYGQSDSISAIRMVSKSKMQKANGDLPAYLNRIGQQAQSMEQLQQGKFIIILNPLGNGQYELQVYRMVKFGKKRVVSTFASVYKTGIEYSYSYDAQTREIQQFHFICPANSLTCWADPQDYASFKQFIWEEKFPSNSCSLSVFTSEEYGREYVQASCFPNRDAALLFAIKFIDYVTGARGL
jgi:hypothetical protein